MQGGAGRCAPQGVAGGRRGVIAGQRGAGLAGHEQVVEFEVRPGRVGPEGVAQAGLQPLGRRVDEKVVIRAVVGPQQRERRAGREGRHRPVLHVGIEPPKQHVGLGVVEHRVSPAHGADVAQRRPQKDIVADVVHVAAHLGFHPRVGVVEAGRGVVGLFAGEGGVALLVAGGALVDAGRVELVHRRGPPGGAQVGTDGQAVACVQNATQSAGYGLVNGGGRFHRHGAVVQKESPQPAVIVAQAGFEGQALVGVLAQRIHARAVVAEVRNQEFVGPHVGLGAAGHAHGGAPGGAFGGRPGQVQGVGSQAEEEVGHVAQGRVVGQLVAVLGAGVGLAGEGGFHGPGAGQVGVGAHLQQLVYHGLVGPGHSVVERIGRTGPLAPNGRREVGNRAGFGPRKDAQPGIEAAKKRLAAHQRPAHGPVVAQGGRKVLLAQAGVVEVVVGRAGVARAAQRALQPGAEAPQAAGAVHEGRLHEARDGPEAAVAHAHRVQLAAHAGRVGQGGGLHEHHAADGIGPVADAGGTLDDGEAGGGEGVDFRGVVGPPLLAFLAHAVVENQYPVAVKAVDDGLGNRRPGLDAVHAADAFEGFAQAQAPRLAQGRPAEGFLLLAHQRPRLPLARHLHVAQLLGIGLEGEILHHRAFEVDGHHGLGVAHEGAVQVVGARAEAVKVVVAVGVGGFGRAGFFEAQHGAGQGLAGALVGHAAGQREAAGRPRRGGLRPAGQRQPPQPTKHHAQPRRYAAWPAGNNSHQKSKRSRATAAEAQARPQTAAQSGQGKA